VRFILAFVGIVTFLTIGSVAQTPSTNGAGSSISGRVTLAGKGVEGITVVLLTPSSPLGARAEAKAITDSEGNYRIEGVKAGSFSLRPIAKAYIVQSRDMFNIGGKSITIGENEALKDIDFILLRGGVITGRITDLEGRPIIGEFVRLSSETKGAPSQTDMILGGTKYLTDDRGVYRLYGLAPGHYKVSVGNAPSEGSRGLAGGGPYVQTFYPGVAEEEKATLVEVKEGTETTNIDITPGSASKGFAVSGHVSDESGDPVPSLFINIRPVKTDEDGDSGSSFSFSGAQSDTNGSFRIEGVRPGHYTASTMSFGGATPSYSDPVPFEVSDGDVKGVEIKVRRGSTIDGVAAIENAADPSVAAILRSVSLYGYVTGANGQSSPSFSRSTINSDGSFRMAGLSPGKAWIQVVGFPNPPKGLQLVRTELNGVEQPEGIEITAGANVTGVRLVFEYGTAKVRGEVKIEGGQLPEGSSIGATLLREGQADKFTRFANVDSRRRFLFEDVPPGVYQLSIVVQSSDVMIKPSSKTVTIGGETEVTANITLDVSKKVVEQE
jgi:protocatechuate 3,4-dioxygenase beta subunit